MLSKLMEAEESKVIEVPNLSPRINLTEAHQTQGQPPQDSRPHVPVGELTLCWLVLRVATQLSFHAMF